MLSKRGYCGTVFIFTFYAQILMALLCPTSFAVEDSPDSLSTYSEKKLNLFNTYEIRGSLKAFKNWQALEKKANEQIVNFHSCSDQNPDHCDSISRSWMQMEKTARKKTSMEQIKWVNQFFNRWPYRLDLDIYGQRDYWATPREFMKLSGDCEDYSISKYFALRSLGHHASSLRIVVLKDTIRNLGHAVLAVTMESDTFILDNLSNVILNDKRYTHYQPQYSLNEDYRWAHIRTTSKANLKPLNDNL